jgi:hypothetical protein
MPLRRLLPIGVLVLGLVQVTDFVRSETKGHLNTHAEVVALDYYSVMPKGPQWTRPAPTTWSSRANVRWQARWGGDGRYMA